MLATFTSQRQATLPLHNCLPAREGGGTQHDLGYALHSLIAFATSGAAMCVGSGSPLFAAFPGQVEGPKVQKVCALGAAGASYKGCRTTACVDEGGHKASLPKWPLCRYLGERPIAKKVTSWPALKTTGLPGCLNTTGTSMGLAQHLMGGEGGSWLGREGGGGMGLASN